MLTQEMNVNKKGEFVFENWVLSGCKENHFYSLPFGQAEASIY